MTPRALDPQLPFSGRKKRFEWRMCTAIIRGSVRCGSPATLSGYCRHHEPVKTQRSEGKGA